MVCVSSMIAFDSARVAGSEQITSSVAWVSALIGLRQTLPQSFSQISSRMRSRHRRLHAGLDEDVREPLHVLGDFAGGLAERKAVAIDVTDHAGRLDLGRRDRRCSRSRAAASISRHCRPPGSMLSSVESSWAPPCL